MTAFRYKDAILIYKYEDNKIMWRRLGPEHHFQKSKYKSIAEAIKKWGVNSKITLVEEHED